MSTSKIDCHAELHPVGQGCFYSASIKLGEAIPFSLVYDCGVNPRFKIVLNGFD